MFGGVVVVLFGVGFFIPFCVVWCEKSIGGGAVFWIYDWRSKGKTILIIYLALTNGD